MKFLLITLSIIVGFTQCLAGPESDWNAFKLKYKKRYNAAQDDYRRGLFEETVKKVAEHQKNFEKKIVSYEIEVNNFADMTNGEFDKLYNGRVLKGEFGRASFARNFTLRSLPASVDWVKYGYNNPILSQGNCGSCYTFAAVAALEGQYFIKYKKLIKLSQQELLDCSRTYGNKGCYGGGWQRNIYNYMLANNGVGYESFNTYKDEERVCKKGGERVTISGFNEIKSGDENALKQAVASIGPIPIDMDHSRDSFRGYKTGIYYDDKCNSNNLTHAMTVVGYGTENGKDYWLIRNSWGDWWGEKGYIRVARNRNNHCGVATRAVYPIVN